MADPRPASRYAAIDIGTVTCRLLIADVDDNGLHELERMCAITNLGEGVDKTGCLKPEAMGRVAGQVAQFQKRIAAYQDREHPAITTIATATSAARDAKNSAEFLRILGDMGVALHIISGEKEATLSFLGVSESFPGEELLVVDIGGGSTEVSLGRAGAPPLRSHSFDVGCRRVTERFLASDPPTDAELADARAWVAGTMQGYFEGLSQEGFAVGRLVAVAGTATSVVSVHKRMKVYDSAQVHRAVISRKTLLDVYGALRSVPLAQRRLTVGLEPDRASVIVAGLAILDVVMGLAGQDSFTVSETDILQGIILDTAAKS